MRVFLHGTGQWFCEIDCAHHLRCQKKGLRKRVPWRSRENTELPLFDLTTVAKPLVTSQAATSWEKVALDLCTRRDDIAVKRLSKNSGQEMREFKNDIILAARLAIL
ncbi:G-type lectin S-receptor-like serine/threonine-protein kinase RKS1 isoform X2 [Pyrus communis]|uniref:G-type lectin S-receptor-like serine/threonine-protein kinase RKS1 isoform X2 n=1 Tax=Pyrus communis TaxID=23211 RepID=UPI0035BED8BD